MYQPTVAIVGRPNVGKSTLFNKLVGQRVSITEDSPGVTRDRIYREVEWLGNHFRMIDTGGLDTGSDDVFLREIRRQVEIAVEEADAIVFVVDGKEGVNPHDRDIAQLLRRSNLPVIVCVNKIDMHRTPDSVYEFYELGFEKLQVISGEQGFGLGDLLDEILEVLPEGGAPDPYADITKIAVVGKPNVGKSSLINALLGQDRHIVTDIAGTTRDAIDSLVEYEGKSYVFIDTAGLRRKRSISDDIEHYSVVRTLNAVDRAELCILMIDATEGITEQDTKIAGYAHDNKKASIIVVNKWDAIEKDTNTVREFEESIRTKLGFMAYAPIVTISVKTGLRIPKMFEAIETVDNYYSFRISTGVLNDLISEAVLLNPPPQDKGRSFKIYYGAQVSTRAPKFVLHINDEELMHFSYLRYLENQIRRRYAFTGTPLTFDLKPREEDERV